ncbi:MAG: hypothetical protein K2N74_02985, partial [Clostridiales bacterium]|nr:hypothetical protein [Clostridiales bacterium]
MIQTITADTKRIALSSTRRVYKTEGFITPTRRILAIDAFISRIAEGIFSAHIALPDGCYSAQTKDQLYTLYFQVKGDSVVFYQFSSANAAEGGTDRRLGEYISAGGKITLNLSETDDVIPAEDIKRLYLESQTLIHNTLCRPY